MSEIHTLIDNLPNLTPRQIVEQLDRYIIGQTKAKRACAIALRNRRRRQQVEGDLKDEILPKNILMVGATGVGKTEIARRLAKLAHSPFIKVEATKFTEVGYVGRDVESMIRDLVEISVNMVKEEQATQVRAKAHELAIDKVLDLYLPPVKPGENLPEEEREAIEERHKRNLDRLREQLLAGELDDQKVEMNVPDNHTPAISVFNGSGMEEIGFQLRDMLPNIFGNRTKNKRVPIKEAVERMQTEQESKMIDMEQVTKLALERAENSGIIFLDEIDKIAGGNGNRSQDVSRGGVQRDLLPIIEGCTVNTKYGMVKTDHILFIAAGAFHVSKPSELLPELQGRLPIKVDLEALTEEDFLRILVEPKNSLIKQNAALLATEGIELEFTEDAIGEIARISFTINETKDNIGARRLHAVMESVLDELFFDAPDLDQKKFVVDKEYVQKQVKVDTESDLSKHIL